MHDFRAFFLKQHYDCRIAEQDKLSKIERLNDWEKFRPLIARLYHNKSSKGGRPNMDEIVMLKCLVLQSYYNLSDPQLEFQLNDRISFQNFIGLSQSVPDFTTIWRFRERLAKSRVEPLIWEELQRQLVEHGIVVKKGVIQDATFIEAPVGRKRKDKGGNQGSEKESPEKSSQLDTDASFSVKRKQIHHGYKLHIKVDVDYGFIRKLATTTAKDHDSRIELSEPEDRRMYRDKGYFGVPLRHPEVEDWTMQRAVRNRSLTAEEKARNRRISHIRSPGERPFAVLKNIFGRGHTRLKRLARVKVQQLFNCFTFNIHHLYHCKRRGRLAADGRASRDHSGCAPEALA